MNASGHAQFNIVMSQVYCRSPKRMTQNGLVTLAGSSKVSPMSRVPMAHTCNPSYSGGRDQED
jgi:hypothetical protein